MFIQELLIKLLLNPINNLMKKTTQKFRDFLFIFGGLGLTAHCILWGARLIPYRFLIYFTISCFFMGIMILGCMGKDILPVRFRMSVFIPWTLCGIIMLFSGIINNVDYMPDAILILVAFPIFYICCSNNNREAVFKKILFINKLSLITFIALSFLFIQITQKKYPGFSVNVNVTSTLLSVASIMIVIELLYEEKFSKKTVFNILLLGVATALNYYTNSRTGPLALILSGIVILILFISTHSVKINTFVLAKFSLCLVTALVLTASVLYVFQLRKWLPLPYIDLKNKIVFMDERWKTTSNTQTPTNSSSEETNNKFFGNEGFQDVNQQKFNTDKTLDKFSTGRISVWKAYAKDLNLTGHSSTPTVYVDFLSKKDIASTHMTILQVAYESGIFAGIFYLIFNITSGILSIVFAFKHKDEKHALFPLAVIIAFGIISLLASNRSVFLHYNTLMYYLILFPIMIKTKTNSTQDII